ncbi:MAG: hypothetical protein K6C06_04635 [Lachnospiraceae bacterium]|nr:hypothetical protein [Lachnospiraceae bacterium]
MMGNERINTGDPLIVYCYRQISDPMVFSDLLRKRFRQTGHAREIEFRFWDCYKQLPGQDGDLYIFDGMVLSALADKGYIRRLPDIIDTSSVFEWVLNGSKFNQQIFGLPFMLCTDVLISKKGTQTPLWSLSEGEIAAPMKSMIGEYYIFAYFNSSGREEKSLEILKRLAKLIGGSSEYERSRFSEYDGIRRFIRGDCKYLLGFTEDLRYLPRDEYVVRFANISDSASVELPFYYVNYISVGTRPEKERLLDCLDLIEIITERSFFMDYCTGDGLIRYLLSADRKPYEELCSISDLYGQLYAMVSDENNCVLRYGKQFYETFPRKSAELHAMLSGNAGM